MPALLCLNCTGRLGQFTDDLFTDELAVVRPAAEYVRFHRISQHAVAAFPAVGISVRPIQLR